MWRNWQTRKIQDLVIARLCRFKSCHPHHDSWIKMLSTAKTLKNDEFFGVFCCFSGNNATFVLRKNRFRFYAVFYLFLC